MEPEEKKAKKGASSKEKSTTKKPTATSTRGTNKKTSTTKGSATKKATTSKEKETTKKAETIAKTTSTKKAPVKKTSVSKVETKNKTEKTPQNKEIIENKELKEDIKTENNPNKETKNNQKYIDISIGAIFCVIIIIALIIVNVKLGKHAYKILKNQSTDSDVQTDNNISVTQEIGNVLKKTDDLVQQMQEKITYPSNVTASIYNSQGFNTNTISNELKLILGWVNTDVGSKLKSKNEKNEEVESIEKNIMTETIKNTLGPNVKYTDESFNYTKISLFENASRNKGIIDYNNNVYTDILENSQEEEAPLIYQEIQKVVKYSDTIIVYVKTAFIDYYDGTYVVYKNFKNNNFADELLQTKKDKLFNRNTFDQYTGKGSVTTEENSVLKPIKSQLNTYKYIFTFNEEMKDYYLSEFRKDTI